MSSWIRYFHSRFHVLIVSWSFRNFQPYNFVAKKCFIFLSWWKRKRQSVMQFSSVLHLHRKSIKLVLECEVFVTFPSFLKSDYQLRRFIESSTKLFSFRVLLKLSTCYPRGLELVMTTFRHRSPPLCTVFAPELTSSIICGHANIPPQLQNC
jgi:hypothetical protein